MTSANKQTNKKQTPNKHRTNSKVFLFNFNSCQVPVQWSKKSFIDLYAGCPKTLKTLRCLPKRISSTWMWWVYVYYSVSGLFLKVD